MHISNLWKGGSPECPTPRASLGAGSPKSVEFMLDGTPIGQSGHPPYQLDFDPRGRAAKGSVLTVTAHAQDGKTATDTAPVSLNGATERCDIPR